MKLGFESFAGIRGSFALKRISENIAILNTNWLSSTDKSAIKIFNANHNKQDRIINYGDIINIDYLILICLWEGFLVSLSLLQD